MNSLVFSLLLAYTQSSSAAHSTATPQPEYFDEPRFTVAGVADNTYRGARGSDAPWRSTEALIKAAAGLKESAQRHSLADEKERQGKPLEAVREYQRVAELDPSEPNLFDWGTELLTHRAAEPAEQVFAKGHRLFPRSRRMLLGLAVALYAHGDYDQAAERFFEACDLEPGDPDSYLFLGKVQNRESTQSDGYLERLGRFATLQPDNALANYYYAKALWSRRMASNNAEVQMLLEKAIRINPHLAEAWLQLGVLYSEQKNYTQAVLAYRKAIDASPELEEAHYRLSQTYAVAGEKQRAEEELDIYRQLSKKSAEEAERERRELQQFVIELRR